MIRAGVLVLQLFTAQAPAPATPAPGATAESQALPPDVDALYKLGLAFLNQGQPKKAVPPLKKLLEKAPEIIAARVTLSRALRLTGETEEARALLVGSIAMYPEELTLRAERGL